jgi:aromatic ring-cleaving dioxygenase
MLAFMTDFFSVKMIFRTLFDPWKRDQVSYKNLSLQERFNVFILNLSSRLIGFLVKIIFFVVYLLFLGGFFIVFAISVVVWLSLPFLALSIILLGIYEILATR